MNQGGWLLKISSLGMIKIFKEAYFSRSVHWGWLEYWKCQAPKIFYLGRTTSYFQEVVIPNWNTSGRWHCTFKMSSFRDETSQDVVILPLWCHHPTFMMSPSCSVNYRRVSTSWMALPVLCRGLLHGLLYKLTNAGLHPTEPKTQNTSAYLRANVPLKAKTSGFLEPFNCFNPI